MFDIDTSVDPVWKTLTEREGLSDGGRQGNTFAFELARLEDRRTRLRFTQNYAVELSDDDKGIDNFNWGYYLESLRLLCTAGTEKPHLAGA